MSRGLSAENLTAAQALHVRPLEFVEFQFDTATVRIHNGVGTYTFNSQTWTGIGALGSVSPIEEGIELSPYGVTMELWALDPTFLAEALQEAVFNRTVTWYQGFLDENGQLVDTPAILWKGSGDNTSISLGGERDVITLQCESALRFLELANGARFTDEDQQQRYSGDVLFEYLPQMMDAQVIWGPHAAVVSPGVTPWNYDNWQPPPGSGPVLP